MARPLLLSSAVLGTASELVDAGGRYEILRRISSGGMAEVFLARFRGSQGFERLVAVKRLLPGLRDRPRLQEMFRREARLCGRFHHPNLVSVVDVDHDSEGPFFAMDYIQGCTLAHLLRDAVRHQQGMPLAVVLRIAIDVCQGLHYAHELEDASGPLDVVHRDVSPSNVIIAESGFATVADFGVARIGAWETDLDDAIVGKWSYMAPDQLRDGSVDRRADLFSVGILLYEMLASRKLFRSRSETALLEEVSQWKVPPAARLLPGVEKPLADVVATALHDEREHRFSSARELAVALEDCAFELRIGASSTALARYLGRHGHVPERTLSVVDDLEQTVHRPRSRVRLPSVTAVSSPRRAPSPGGVVIPIRPSQARGDVFDRAETTRDPVSEATEPSICLEWPESLALPTEEPVDLRPRRRPVRLLLLGAVGVIVAAGIGFSGTTSLSASPPEPAVAHPAVHAPARGNLEISAAVPADDAPQPVAEAAVAHAQGTEAAPAAAPGAIEGSASKSRRAPPATRAASRASRPTPAEATGTKKPSPAWDPNSALPPG